MKDTTKRSCTRSFPLVSILFIAGILLVAFTDQKEIGMTLIWIGVWIIGILLVVVFAMLIIVGYVFAKANPDDIKWN